MLYIPIISQDNRIISHLDDQPSVIWNASTDGNYPALSEVNQVNTIIWEPTTEGVETYNHHPFVVEFGGALHVIHSTTDENEENPGQYIRYTKSEDGGTTWAPYSVIFEPQDDSAKNYTEGGRVILPSDFAIIDGDLYAVCDVNDRGPGGESRPRYGVGVLARKINLDGTFGTVYWIENKDGTLTAPDPITGFPSYAFNETLRLKIRTFFYDNPELRPDWYFSTPKTDFLHTERFFNSNSIREPRIVKLPTGQFLKIWRLIVSGASTKIAQTSEDGFKWSPAYDTGIPDSPSRTMALRLLSGEILIIGNNEGGLRDPLFGAFSKDGLTYNSGNIYTIDNETGGADFGGFGKGTGVQYPHAIQLKNGRIAVVYSVNKEDIKISIFDKPELL